MGSMKSWAGIKEGKSGNKCDTDLWELIMCRGIVLSILSLYTRSDVGGVRR